MASTTDYSDFCALQLNIERFELFKHPDIMHKIVLKVIIIIIFIWIHNYYYFRISSYFVAQEE